MAQQDAVRAGDSLTAKMACSTLGLIERAPGRRAWWPLITWRRPISRRQAARRAGPT